MLSWRPCTSRYLSLKTIPVCKFVYFWFKQIAIFNNVRNKSSSSKYGGEAGKLAILAFPCNQFGAQEPGTCEIIFLKLFEHITIVTITIATITIATITIDTTITTIITIT